MKNNNMNHMKKDNTKKNNIKILIASLALAIVAAGSAVVITACVPANAEEPTVPTTATQVVTETASAAPTEQATQAPT